MYVVCGKEYAAFRWTTTAAEPADETGNLTLHWSDYVIGPDCVSIKATTAEGLGFVGRSEGCSFLRSINIPSSVTIIGDRVFEGCSALTALTVDANNPRFSAEGCMLFNKEKTNLICAAGSKKTYDIPSSVTSIGWFAFSGCSSLTSINIPSSVTSIGHSAF